MKLSGEVIDYLRMHFVARTQTSTVGGHVTPDTTDLFDLGQASYRFKNIYCQTIHADSISGDPEYDADTVDGYHGDEFAALAENETIAGAWVHNNHLRINAGYALKFDADALLERVAADTIRLGSGDALRSYDYISGPQGSGWQINADGSAEFHNVFVRGELHAAVFVKDMIEAHAGTMLIAKSAGTITYDPVLEVDGMTVPTSGTWSMYIEDPPGGGFLFDNSDICRCKTEYSGGVCDLWYTVSSRTDMGGGVQRYTCTWNYGDRSAERVYPSGAPVVDYGQSGQGFLLMTADWTNSPYYEVGMHTGTPWLGYSAGQLKVRLGNLTGVGDTDLNPTGYGLYTNNAYLKGNLWAANGACVIDGEGITVGWGTGPENKIKIVGSDATNENVVLGFYESVASDVWGTHLVVANNASHKAHLKLGGYTPNFDMEIIIDADDSSDFARTRFVFNDTTELFRVSNTEITFFKDILPSAHDTWDIGSDTVRVSHLYVENLHATSQTIGEELTGQIWSYAGDMYIKPESASANTILYVLNSDATYHADLNLEGSLVLGGTVDGVDIASFKSAYDALASSYSTHTANANAHHNRAHYITNSSDHAATGSAFDLVGLTATDTLGMITPSANPVQTEKILKTTSAGLLSIYDLTAYDLTVTNTLTADINITGTDSDTFTINDDGEDVNVDLIFKNDTDGNATIRWDGIRMSIHDELFLTTDNVGIGIYPSTDKRLAINWINTTLSGNTFAIFSQLYNRVASGAGYGHAMYARADTAVNVAGNTGGYFFSSAEATGGSVTGSVIGVYGHARMVNTMTVGGTFAAGYFVTDHASDANITNIYGAYINTGHSTGSGVVTNAFGLYINNITGATNNYAIKTNAGNIVFNESADANTDFRVESSGEPYILFVDAGNDVIGVKTSSPYYSFDAVGTIRATTFRIGTGDPTNNSIFKGASGQLELDTDVGVYTNDLVLISDVAWVAPTAKLTVQNASTPQLRVAYDATNIVDLSASSGGNFVIKPLGDIVFDPDSYNVVPETAYEINLGAIENKFLTLHVSEIWASKLVAQETIATIGGRILVGTSTELTSDVIITELLSSLNYSFEIAGGGGSDVFADWEELAGNGTIERATDYVYHGTYSCKMGYGTGQSMVYLNVNVTASTLYNLNFYSRGDGTNQGQYAVYDETNEAWIITATDTGITAAAWGVVSEDFTTPSGCILISILLYSPSSSGYAWFDLVALSINRIFVKHNSLLNGDIVYLEAPGKVEFMKITSAYSGSGPYEYSVERNLDGTGLNDWYKGDVVFNTGQTGSGWIDIYSIASMKPGVTQSGPTIVGNVRTGTTYNSWAESWAIGNLHGVYGQSNKYGVGLGQYKGTNWMVIDETNGVRFFASASETLLGQLSNQQWTLGASGLANPDYLKITPTSGIEMYSYGSSYVHVNPNSGTPYIRVGKSGVGRVQIDNTKVQIWDGNNARKFLADATDLYVGYVDTGKHIRIGASYIDLISNYKTSIRVDNTPTISLYDANTVKRIYVETAGITVGNSTEGTYTYIASNKIELYSNSVRSIYIDSSPSINMYDANGNRRMILNTNGMFVGGWEPDKPYISVSDNGITFARSYTAGAAGWISTNGDFWFGKAGGAKERIAYDPTYGLRLFNKDNQAVIRFPTASAAIIENSLYAGGGNVLLSSNGITINSGSGESNAVTWKYSAATYSYIRNEFSGTANTNALHMYTYHNDAIHGISSADLHVQCATINYHLKLLAGDWPAHEGLHFFDGSTTIAGVYGASIGWRFRLYTNCYLQLDERSTTPGTPNTGSQVNVYMKGDKIIFQYYNGTSNIYKYMLLGGSSTTWYYTTTAP